MLFAAILSAWLQYGADSEPHARAVVTDLVCPSLVVDGRAVPMTERAAKSPQFDDVVCDAALTRNAKLIRLGNRELPAPARNPRRIVVLGDTGCRINLLNAQSCDDPHGGPVPRVAQRVAAGGPELPCQAGARLD